MTGFVLYADSRSGNCYKIELVCAELGIDYEWQEVDILAGETRTPDFLRLNPNGRIPLARFPGGRCLAESNAIIAYLAEGTALAGLTRFARAKVMEWLFFEQYSHEPNIATSRFVIRFLGSPPERQASLEQKQVDGHHALRVMDTHLDQREFMLGKDFTIADIALYAYTHIAGEGGFDLDLYPSIGRWLSRIESRDRFRPMRTVGH